MIGSGPEGSVPRLGNPGSQIQRTPSSEGLLFAKQQHSGFPHFGLGSRVSDDASSLFFASNESVGGEEGLKDEASAINDLFSSPDHDFFHGLEDVHGSTNGADGDDSKDTTDGREEAAESRMHRWFKSAPSVSMKEQTVDAEREEEEEEKSCKSGSEVGTKTEEPSADCYGDGDDLMAELALDLSDGETDSDSSSKDPEPQPKFAFMSPQSNSTHRRRPVKSPDLISPDQPTVTLPKTPLTQGKGSMRLVPVNVMRKHVRGADH